MKNLFKSTILVSFLILSGCTAKNKTDNSTDSADTSGYVEQPQDKTQMNDTIQMQGADTAKLHPDTVQH